MYQSRIFSAQVYSNPLYSTALFVKDISRIAHTFWIASLYSLNTNHLSPSPFSRTTWTGSCQATCSWTGNNHWYLLWLIDVLCSTCSYTCTSIPPFGLRHLSIIQKQLFRSQLIISFFVVFSCHHLSYYLDALFHSSSQFFCIHNTDWPLTLISDTAVHRYVWRNGTEE